MQWLKKGRIYTPPFDGSWKDNSALTPTPFMLNSDVIRIYTSFRDPQGIGRIGFVDVESSNPSHALQISQKPALDVGEPGCFDDNGLLLGDIIQVNDEIWMYYGGFQLVDKIKFMAFTGLAISRDGGNQFERHQHTPVLDRSDEGLYMRVVHSVLRKDDKFQIWYGSGSGWEFIDDNPYPRYDIRTMESSDGINFGPSGKVCLPPNATHNEYRIGRPRVYRVKGKYVMNFTYGTLGGDYLAGQATSPDCIDWKRDDTNLGIELSETGWDAKHLCYPAIISAANKTYMFYNGNNMGYEGFGYAELISNELM